MAENYDILQWYSYFEKSGDKYCIVTFDRTKPLSTLELTDNQYSNDNAKKVIDEIWGTIMKNKLSMTKNN